MGFMRKNSEPVLDGSNLSKLLETASASRFVAAEVTAGWKSCSRCPCGQYDAAGNDYCQCGHSFTDHW